MGKNNWRVIVRYNDGPDNPIFYAQLREQIRKQKTLLKNKETS